MNAQKLKSRLGRWLTIEELRDALSEIPDEIGNGIPVNRKLLETASDFVEERNGWWEHGDWEGFLGQLSEAGFQLSDASRDSVGNILEIFKNYYQKGDFETIKDKKRKPAAPKSPSPKRRNARPA